MAFRVPRPGHARGPGERPRGLRQTFAGKRGQHAEMPHDIHAGTPLQLGRPLQRIFYVDKFSCFDSRVPGRRENKGEQRECLQKVSFRMGGRLIEENSLLFCIRVK